MRKLCRFLCFFVFVGSGEKNRNRALVGAHQFDDNIDGAMYVDVWDQEIHPDYDETSEFSNDFLVARLSGWVPNGVVTLNDDDGVPKPDDELTVMGFGLTSENGQSGSDLLLAAQVDYVDPDTCKQLLSNFTIEEDIKLCAYREGSDRYVYYASDLV